MIYIINIKENFSSFLQLSSRQDEKHLDQFLAHVKFVKYFKYYFNAHLIYFHEIFYLNK
jgi:hypothetical protein